MTGTFRDRAKFLAALKERLAGIKRGLPGFVEEAWEESDGGTRASLRYLGAELAVIVGASDWSAALTVPPGLPIARSVVEARIEKELRSIEA